MDLYVYGPIPEAEPAIGDAFEVSGEVDTSFAFGALAAPMAAPCEARAKKVARPRLSPAEVRAARAAKTREANARLRRILPKNSPLFAVFFPPKRKQVAA
jgi:hypothetical protein